MAHINSDILRLGVDVGSTTVKAVALDPADNSVLFTRYQRHNAHQADTVRQLLEEVAGHFPGMRFRIGVCGSGGRPIAAALGACYVQEVVANAAAVRALYPEVRTAVELGGQDAKVIFFRYDEASGKLQTSDMRMNGSCAGGTGAFIDEIATLLNVPADEFEQLAARGKTVYSISGRCGVFAKTDIQPLLIQGAERADIALSTFHAIAKQTIGGLSQGLELTAPIIFEGGPLTFNPTLVRVFAERLNLEERDIVRPDHPETIVARGTAIAIDELFPGQEDAMTLAEAMERLDKAPAQTEGPSGTGRPFFASDEEREVFLRRHRAELRQPVDAAERKVLRGYIGIDSGSTTSKFVFIDENEQVTDTFYANNQGEPLKVVREGLLALAEKYEKLGIQLEVLGLGTTGYGEQMLSAAFHADYHTVETVAHARGCRRFFPDATFLLDIGGQDMKAIWLKDGVVTNIMLNEACSSGCGSFLENFAATLGMPVDQVADAAFRSQAPAELGSRCTVFMNSTIINEQRNGKQPDDLMAGLCRSIIENVFTKVVRIANVAELGDRVVVQGGTFRNFAVLRALEEYLGRDVTLAPYPGEMGALGAALAVKQEVEAHGYANGRCSAFIGFDAVKNFQYTRESGVLCPHCTNHCSRTILHFPDGGCYVTGNRCDRGAVVMEAAPAHKAQEVPDLFRLRQELLFKTYPVSPVREEQSQTVGLPRVLVTGELLVNFHPGTNFHVEEYLERNDMEVILPRITYQFRKDFQAAISEIRDFGAHLAPYPFALDGAVEFIQRFLERIARSHPLYHPAARPQDLYSDVEHFIPKTLTCGEGWLMAGEIAHYAHQGVRSFIILQPFGCLPNHVCGRGVTKRLKEEFPGVQILPLDLDPDASYANVENRLQMLIMNQTAEAEHSAASVEPAPQKTRGGSPRPALSST